MYKKGEDEMPKPVVPHHNYHPESWSKQARALANAQVVSVELGYCTIKEVRDWFRKSYRHPLIVNRAAKRFGRLVRSGKVHEKS